MGDICEAFSQVGIVGSGCDGSLTAAPITTTTTTTSTRRPQSSTDSPNNPDGNCVDTFSSCDFIVRIGHCSRMGDVCARTCGYCSEATTTTAATTFEATTSLVPTAPGTSASVTTTRAISTEL